MSNITEKDLKANLDAVLEDLEYLTQAVDASSKRLAILKSRKFHPGEECLEDAAKELESDLKLLGNCRAIENFLLVLGVQHFGWERQ